MAATTSATGTRYRAASERGRPLSTVQLISPDKAGEDGEEETADDEKRDKKRASENFTGKFSVHRNDSGIENDGFELGSPLSVDNRQSKVSYHEFKLCGGNARHRSAVDPSHEQKRPDAIIRESLQFSNGNVQRSGELRTPLTVSMEDCNVKAAEQRDRTSGAHSDGPGALKRHMETPVRSSWLLDGNVRRRDDAVWRRRKTDPSGDVCTSNYSYHRDYQEALSSLLWEPYDCRQPENPAQPQSAFGGGCSVDEGDVSVWLYPRIMRTAHLSSSSSSTLSLSSYSSSAVVSAMGTSGDGHVWSRDARDPSSSSLRALILSNSSSKDEDLTTSFPCSNNALKLSELRSEPIDVSPSCGSNTIGNVTGDPDQQDDDDDDDDEEAEGSRGEDAVADLHTRWAVAGPPGALQSADRCELCWQSCDQCESSAATMLVSVAGADAAPSVSASGSGAVTSSSSVSVVSCYRAVPVVVSSVPTISCLNVSHVNVEAGVSAARARTFTSTEAQTDDIGVAPATPSNNNREQRRRERRERRHQRRANNNNNNNNNPPHWQTLVAEPPPAASGGERLPDILNSHLPPPYSTLPLGLPPPGHVVHPHVHHPPPPPPVPVPVPVTTAPPGSPPPPPHHHHHGGMRFPFQITPGERRR